MSAAEYFVDGEWLNETACRAAFAGATLEYRERLCLDWIDGERVVDIGCYSGGFVAAVLARYPGSDVVGVDYDEENLKIARLLHPDLGNRFRKMSVYELDFEDSSVDTVTFQEVIEHLEGAAAAVKEINRVLKPGGILILSTTNPYFWRDFAVFAAREISNGFRRLRGKQAILKPVIFFDNVEWNRHIYNWTPSTLLTLLMVNGFVYEKHAYGREATRLIERIFLRLFPFLGPTQLIKVRKREDAPQRTV